MKREWWSAGFFDMEMARVLFNPERMGQAKKETSQVLKLTGLKKGARVLDAACGVGRHSLEFARRGLHTTGIDISDEYILQARRQIRRNKIDLKLVEFQKGELRDLYRFHGAYDLVVNLFTSFGYYELAQDNLQALKQMSQALRPGGWMVMELMPRETLQLVFQDRDWEKVGKGYLLHKRSWHQGGRRVKGEHIFIEGSRQREAQSDLFVYTLEELAFMFKRAGLKQVKAYGDFSGRPFVAGDRLVMTGRK